MKTTENKNTVDIIKEFVFNDEVQHKLSQIRNSVKEFNIFEIAGMHKQEIKHSNTLAWFFGNNEHGLGEMFFIEFLKKAIEATESNKEYFANLKIDLDKLKKYIYLSKNKKELEVRREYKNIDILIIDRNNNFLFLIENKIDASESENQLNKYYNLEFNEFNNIEEIYYLFLTIDSSEPNELYDNSKIIRQNYLLCSYESIGNIISDMLKKHRAGNKTLKKETVFIMENYKDLLKRRNIVGDKRLENLCSDIWSIPEYSDALEILIENKPSIISNVLDEVLEEDKDIERLDKTGTKRKAFIPKKLDNHPIIKELHDNTDGIKNSGYWRNKAILFRIYIEGDRLNWALQLESKTNKNQELITAFFDAIEGIEGIKKGNRFSLTGTNSLCKFNDLYDSKHIKNEILENIGELKKLSDSIIEKLDEKLKNSYLDIYKKYN